MKHILIPTDFSENSHNAIQYAVEYFSDVPVRFYILHVSYQNSSFKEEAQENSSDFSTEIQTFAPLQLR